MRSRTVRAIGPMAPRIAKGPSHDGKVSAGGHAPWCGLKRAYAGKVGRLAHRSAAIAAQPRGRKACGDRSRLAAARSSRGHSQAHGLDVRPYRRLSLS